jgi:hypothetical protein
MPHNPLLLHTHHLMVRIGSLSGHRPLLPGSREDTHTLATTMADNGEQEAAGAKPGVCDWMYVCMRVRV